MTREQYWFDPDYMLFWAYKAKNDIEIKKIERQTNYHSWLSGLYMLQAMGSMFDSKVQYYDQPIDFERMERESIRRANMTEEERIVEDNRKVELQMKLEVQRVMSAISKDNQ